MKIEHHACLIRQVALSVDKALLIYDGVGGDGEVNQLTFSTVGIDEVRDIILKANLRPVNGDFSLLVVVASSITYEAQQALLKILEEPPATTRFLFVIPLDVNLIPTLLSRFLDLSEKGSVSDDVLEMFNLFYHQSYSDRLKEISNRVSSKDNAWIAGMKVGLASYLDADNTLGIEKTKACNFVLESIGTRGASNKLLLEELALLLPSSMEKA